MKGRKSSTFIFLVLALVSTFTAFSAHADGILSCQGNRLKFTARVFGPQNGGFDAAGTLGPITSGDSFDSIGNGRVFPLVDRDSTFYFSFEFQTPDQGLEIVKINSTGFKVLAADSIVDGGPCDNLQLLGLRPISP